MFWKILKKDLKRKKTMNVILLLFVILCAMFASASANNIAAVTGGIDRYFELADVPDAEMTMHPDCKALDDVKALSSVKELKVIKRLAVWSSKNFRYKGEELDTFINPPCIFSADNTGIRLFDKDNDPIETVPKGCFYATSPFTQKSDIKPGDTLELEIGDTKLTLKYLGLMKGATFYTESTANPYLLFNGEDFDTLDKDPAVHPQQLDYINVYIKTDDIKAIQDIAENYPAELGMSLKSDFKSIYLYDMIAAYIMMAISVLLMITAFVVLRFSIGFTISEEFREIGVMKAVGIKNGSIRSLYISKYLVISVLGAAIGFCASIPLGKVMMNTVSENMVLEGKNSVLLGLIAAAAVVAIIMFFCYLCTRRVRKLSAIDAVRCGQTGERFKKKNLMHLGRTKLPATGFLALNDVVSAPKRFGIISLVFAACLLLMTSMSNFVMTLKSEKLRDQFDIPESEICILDADLLAEFMMDTPSYQKTIDHIEEVLAENGMNGKCTTTFASTVGASHGDLKHMILAEVIKGETDYEMPLESGSNPSKTDEIIVTASVLKELKAEVGDRITVSIGGKDYEFIITGTYSSFISPGARLHPDFDMGDETIDSSMGLNIHFDDNPDKATVKERINTLKKVLGSEKIYTISEVIQQVTGLAETMKSIKHMMMILTIIVTSMVVILMERSFISKEKSEIALMKAVGISNGRIIAQHVLRFVITAIIACIIATAAVFPVCNALFGWICSMIGDVTHIECDFDPVDIFVTCPAILIGVSAIGTFLTALYTRTIKASDTASIE